MRLNPFRKSGVAARAERRQRRSREKDGRHEIDVQHRLDLLLRGGFETPCANPAGIVDQDVEASERVKRVL